jgi:anti-sigma28 factor (negative regulator of flagellin synthesis)
MVNDSEETRQLRIARLKRQVAAGTYRVPAEDVADAVVRFFSREMPDSDDGLSRWTPR